MLHPPAFAQILPEDFDRQHAQVPIELLDGVVEHILGLGAVIDCSLTQGQPCQHYWQLKYQATAQKQRANGAEKGSEDEKSSLSPAFALACGSTDVRVLGGIRMKAEPSRTVWKSCPSCSTS